MFKGNWQMTAGLLVLASPLLLGACASNDSVQRAQATADQALAAAQTAQQTAQVANQQASKAEADAAAASQKADRMYQQGLRK